MRILERPPDHKFTYHYSQPAEYRFCQDSVIFPRFVAERVRARPHSRVLDICAGCGVIGFELAYHLPTLNQLDFVEVQEEFRPHVEENCRRTGKDFRFLRMNYTDLLRPKWFGVYDLIVGNPPYFFEGEGKPSPVRMNHRARFFADSDLKTLLKVVRHALHRQGEAYLLIKPGRHQEEVVANIRGTDVVRVVHN